MENEISALNLEQLQFSEFKRQASHIISYFEINKERITLKRIIECIQQGDTNITNITEHSDRQKFNQLLDVYYRVYEKTLTEMIFTSDQELIQFFNDMSIYSKELSEILQILEQIS